MISPRPSTTPQLTHYGSVQDLTRQDDCFDPNNPSVVKNSSGDDALAPQIPLSFVCADVG